MTVQARDAAQEFGHRFGRRPTVSRAPGRVNLIGEHTDYNEGFVLPMAIDRYTILVGDRNTKREVTLHSVTTGETANFSVRVPVQPGQPSWSNYVRGVVAGFQKRGGKVSGFDAIIDSTVPFGGGVSSSAALEVATATLMEALTGQKLDPIEKALLCQQAEHAFAGVPCGIMDQFTSVLAQQDHALLLDCRSLDYEYVPFHLPEITLAVYDTRVPHTLATSGYNERRSQCEQAVALLAPIVQRETPGRVVESLRDVTAADLARHGAALPDIPLRRARHIVSENARVLAAVAALRAGDAATLGALIYASHASLRDDYAVSCAELDAVGGDDWDDAGDPSTYQSSYGAESGEYDQYDEQDDQPPARRRW